MVSLMPVPKQHEGLLTTFTWKKLMKSMQSKQTGYWEYDVGINLAGCAQREEWEPMRKC